jgi:diguanylate cyclase (GGDEF)-like protein
LVAEGRAGPERARGRKLRSIDKFWRDNFRLILVAVLLFLGLLVSRLYSYLLFNTLAGFISVVVSLSVFLFAWNSRRFLEDSYLLLLGVAYLFVGSFDLAYTFAFFGQGVIAGATPDLPAQLWIASRYIQSISLLIAPLFFRRKLSPMLTLSAYAIVSAVLLIGIFGGYFPRWGLGGGATSIYRIANESAILSLLIGALVMLLRFRRRRTQRLLRLLIWSVVFTLTSEFLFAFIAPAYAPSEVLAHFFRIVGTSLIFLAVIDAGFLEPYNLLYHNLKQAQQMERTLRQIADSRSAELEALRANLADILAELELPRLLQAILERAVVLLGASGGELGLYDPENHEIQIVGSHNLGTDSAGTRMALGQGAMGVVAETHEAVILHAGEKMQPGPGLIRHHQWDSVMVVPLKIAERLVGVVSVVENDPDRRFTDADLDLLTLLAHQAAIAINNAQLFERARTQAYTDSLTSLSTRRHFFELAERELGRSRRYGSPLSVIMFDFDHFKQINDRYGHATGDQVLSDAARLLRDQLREVDVVGRYGGDEFVILLPETRLPTARVVAERLRRSIARADFRVNGDDGAQVKLTASLGVAQYTEDCEDIDALLDRADQALYRSKQAGNDQVMAWGD